MLMPPRQAGTCPDGMERLTALLKKVQKRGADKNLAAYVRFRQLTTAYVLNMQAAKSDTAKIQAIQAKWLKMLEKNSPPTTPPDAAEAMLQLAISHEFSGQEDNTKKGYARIVSDFPDPAGGPKGRPGPRRGSMRRPRITLAGQTLTGQPFDLGQYRGKAVLIQYWTTKSAAAKADMPTLKELAAKYARWSSWSA